MTVYEFNITEQVHTEGAPQLQPGEMTIGPAGWGAALSQLCVMSQEGWELVTADLTSREYENDEGRMRSESKVIALWRRPI